MSETTLSAEPRLSVVRGELTDAELAALTVVVSATNSYAPAKPQESLGSQARAFVRRTLLALPNIPGPGSWRRKR